MCVSVCVCVLLLPIVHEKCRKPFCATFAYVTFFRVEEREEGRKRTVCVTLEVVRNVVVVLCL